MKKRILAAFKIRAEQTKGREVEAGSWARTATVACRKEGDVAESQVKSKSNAKSVGAVEAGAEAVGKKSEKSDSVQMNDWRWIEEKRKGKREKREGKKKAALGAKYKRVKDLN
ncbi:uncharacterized protein ARB_03437 [Trichophyton benhamiae CBS 112371]|uniref:Uncharacterized protein n=1 Tax=Arthroderma benhamiae (strain ATCC MYA-4681 / CBS 112371) TaxID=663331 RepID=D4B4P7_ARTBC|nr:uncharacterized protein ARB_03437 [Trichophyton benhamiae CBS 112371]EFE30095.1 hypothetical protein ARB_03437 [Trichophyton benhamiae CBS 112371]